MAGHAQLDFVMTECSKTQIRLTGLIYVLLTAILQSLLLQFSFHTGRIREELPLHDKKAVSGE